MHSRVFPLIATAAVASGLVGCNSDTDKASISSVKNQPVEIKKDKDGWTSVSNLFKGKDGEFKAWKYGQIFLWKIFNLKNGGVTNGLITAGPNTTIYSYKRKDLGVPYIAYNCLLKEWNYSRGEIMNKMQDTYKEEVRTYIKTNGKYTGVQPWGQKPWPTTGYSETKRGWKEKFIGKSGHGISQLTGKRNEIALLIADNKETVLVSGTTDKKVFFKFSFDTPPNQLNKEELCEFAIDGKAIIPAT